MRWPLELEARFTGGVGQRLDAESGRQTAYEIGGGETPLGDHEIEVFALPAGQIQRSFPYLEVFMAHP